MTEALLLDTHIALWLDSGDEKLRPSTRTLIDVCWQNGGRIYFSAVAAWEIASLVDAGRIHLDLPVTEWVTRFLDRPGVEPSALEPRAAASSYEIQNFEHRDRADRLLIATAIDLACPLVTYDERITRFARKDGRRRGFATAA